MLAIVKEHFSIIAGLFALAMIVASTLVLTLHGMKDETLLAILTTGAVGIANTIAGVKPQTTPPPGTTIKTLSQTTADPPVSPLNQ